MTTINDDYYCDNSEDVKTMIRVKITLEACPLSLDTTTNTDPTDRNNFRRCLRSVRFRKILKEVNEYLFLHCRHNYIEDLIDIDPDRSQIIKYCEKCHLISE
jgi:hypothetical protein